MLFLYQAAWYIIVLKITSGGIVLPIALIDLIIVTYSRLPGCTVLGWPALLVLVIIFAVVITPI